MQSSRDFDSVEFGGPVPIPAAGNTARMRIIPGSSTAAVAGGSGHGSIVNVAGSTAAAATASAVLIPGGGISSPVAAGEMSCDAGGNADGVAMGANGSFAAASDGGSDQDLPKSPSSNSMEMLQRQQQNQGGGGGGGARNLKARAAVRYRECLKNHAANIGGHANDGCGEFMPSGEGGSLEALQCAACGCHRNFHRREIEGEGPPPGGAAASPFSCDCRFNPAAAAHHHHHHHHDMREGKLRMMEPLAAYQAAGHLPLVPLPPARPLSLHPPPPPPPPLLGRHFSHHPSSSSSAHHHHHHQQHQHQHQQQMMMMGFNVNPHHVVVDPDEYMEGGLLSPHKKRFRTKFTTEQKEQMCAFAERIGWRIQKQDEEAIRKFCADIGVKRHVLKVWMHNNKHTLGKRHVHHHHPHHQQQQQIGQMSCITAAAMDEDAHQHNNLRSLSPLPDD